MTGQGLETMTSQDVRREWSRPAYGAGAREHQAGTLDTSVANIARVYDFLLGGKDNFAADRAAAEAVLREVPYGAVACQQNRGFLARVVQSLAGAGIRQFLDIGCGLPAAGNVHEMAQRTEPHARVVYVDYDPVVVVHAQAELETGSPGVRALQEDLRDPETIISAASSLLDFSEPVAVLLFAVLHFLTDADQPYQVVRSLTGALAPGSAVALSHLTGEGMSLQKSRAVQEVYQGASAPAVPRSHRDIARFLGGLDLLAPGLTDISCWPSRSPGPGTPLTFYGGAAHTPGCAKERSHA
jgi:SAM-dependent methyltransferase